MYYSCELLNKVVYHAHLFVCDWTFCMIYNALTINTLLTLGLACFRAGEYVISGSAVGAFIDITWFDVIWKYQKHTQLYDNDDLSYVLKLKFYSWCRIYNQTCMETTSLNAVPKSFAISEMDPRDEQFPRILSGEFRPKVESPAYNYMFPTSQTILNQCCRQCFHKTQ